MRYDVYFGERQVGRLEARRARLSFEYSAEAVANGSPALSIRLPVRPERYPHDDADAYFANLLPEDEYRRLIARAVGQSDRSVSGLLGAIGGECAGAVSIWPEGEAPAHIPEYVELDPGAVASLFQADNVQERLALVREARLSLAGGMEKLGLRRAANRWLRSRRGAPTTHVLKWPPTGFENLSDNELLCLELWRAAGISVVEAMVLDVGGASVLVVRRYDREELADGGIRLIHQEDFAQATGTHPAAKYQADGGPGFATCSQVLQDCADVPARERAGLLRWALAGFLTGNEDAHAKNLALLHDVDGTRLAPHYDIACTLIYRGLRRRMAMSYGGEYRSRYVRRRHWEQFAADIGLPFRVVRQEALDLAATFDGVLPEVRSDLESRRGHRPVYDAVSDAVQRQIGLLRREMVA
jgi:serine/threonine-protein kinase HipA